MTIDHLTRVTLPSKVLIQQLENQEYNLPIRTHKKNKVKHNFKKLTDYLTQWLIDSKGEMNVAEMEKNEMTTEVLQCVKFMV